MSETTCPVFYPSKEEFENFYQYMQLIESELSEGIQHGICKIIPPSDWMVPIDYNNVQVKVNNPIKQVVSGRAGIYNVNLFELSPMDLNDFKTYDLFNHCHDNYETREKKFWKSLTTNCDWEDPIYGADFPGSLFNQNNHETSWNLNKIDSLLRLIDDSIPGVNSAMLYIGCWRSMFSYHIEDMNLYSINYLHTGEPKSWYSINSNNKNRFESMADSYFGEDKNECNEYLRHKTKLFSIQKLKENGINYSTALQMPGEFIITLPGAYHAGFNHGYNIAEATNFATYKWINNYGKISKRCICRPNSVKLDINLIECLYFRDLINNNFHSKYSSFNSNLDIIAMKLRKRCFCKTINSLNNSIKNNNKKMNSIDIENENEIENDSLYYKCEGCYILCHKECMQSYFKDNIIISRKLCDKCYFIENKNKNIQPLINENNVITNIKILNVNSPIQKNNNLEVTKIKNELNPLISKPQSEKKRLKKV